MDGVFYSVDTDGFMVRTGQQRVDSHSPHLF